MKHDVLPLAQLQSWATLNDLKFNGVKISPDIITEDGTSKGGGIISTAAHSSGDVLLLVPNDLILSKEQILQCAKTDKHFRELLDALGDFIETPRKAILVFLLMQMTISSPDLMVHSLGVKNSFTDYFRFLPKNIPLPTFFSSEERETLIGTSLSDALASKTASLEKEFDLLKQRTETLEWCRKAWWHEDTGRLTFDDWLLVDAMYRSRALELPQGIGDAMVPVLDMANHGSINHYNARFEVDNEGSVALLVRDGKRIAENEEVLISYGPGGASEMIFSYGFLEQGAVSAREMFLSLSAPDDDPLRIAKIQIAREAPGVRIFVGSNGEIDWESAFVWWICINEEDGLDFEVLQTIEGTRELQALWKNSELDPATLKSTLMADAKRDVFILRAVVMIQQRIEKQGGELSMSEEGLEEKSSYIPESQRSTFELIGRLRQLELDLLTASFGALETQKQELLTSRTVTEYLAGNTDFHKAEGQQEEDFS